MKQADHVPRTGGRILVDQLLVHGVDLAFCVPGESYMAVLDALYDAPGIRLLTCRQEGGAANMAAAYGKLTGRPGVCFVTRGPGATNASIGVHTAAQDAAPLVLFIGQVARAHSGRDAFQEIDYRQMFGRIAKWVEQIDDAARLPELVSRAFHLAVSGRPGPVVLALPEDMLRETTVVGDAGPFQRVQASPGADQMQELGRMLAGAERPFVIVGGSDWTAAAVADIAEFCEANDLPTATTFRRQDLFDNESPCYAGTVGLGMNPSLAEYVDACDLLLVIGDRLSEAATNGYTLIEVPQPRQTFVHVYPDAAELGRIYQADLAILSGLPEFARAARALRPAVDRRWTAWTRDANAAYRVFRRPPPAAETLDLGAVVAHLRARVGPEAIITNGAGNFTIWVHRFYPFSRYGTQVAPTSGAMGYGVPAGVAAKALQPERTVIVFSGDGDFLMNGQELATAVQYGLNIIVLLVDNGMFGTIRMHQERDFPGRVIATDLTNPDFVAYARAFGAHGEAVERTTDFPAALERALSAGKPALLDLRVDPGVLTPSERLPGPRARPAGPAPGM